MNIAAKSLTLGFSMGLGLPLLYTLIKGAGQSKQRKLDQKQFVGIQIGVNNYNVAIGEPVLNNKGQIADFVILKRKNGITDQDPQKSLQEIIRFIRQNQANSKQESSYEFIGISSFGPLCLDQLSPLYGALKRSEKQQWQGVHLLQRIQQSFPKTRVGINLEANVLALAELKLGKHEVRHSLAYISVGTGVSVGLIAHQKPIQGLTHTQAAHMIVERSPKEFQNFRGVCKRHRNRTCLQGMVTSKAIAERLKIDLAELIHVGDDSIVWRIVAFYLAQLCINIALTLSPELIIIGGGLINRKVVLQMIRQEFVGLNEGQMEHPMLRDEKLDQYIVSSQLGGDVGLKGAMIVEWINNK